MQNSLYAAVVRHSEYAQRLSAHTHTHTSQWDEELAELKRLCEAQRALIAKLRAEIAAHRAGHGC
jgi:hypothetical protein